ncbi:MAG TPA: hypothetical protein VHA56_04235 [Mucilaginibacter sp.]|nr:hypothetical protein [Mucilaginibacter sp.]
MIFSNLLNNFIFASPLDQFGEDESSRLFIQSILSKIWLTGLSGEAALLNYLPHEIFEMVFGALDPSFFEGFIAGFASNYIIEDDDSEDSE